MFPVHESITMSRAGRFAHPRPAADPPKSAAQSAPPACGLPLSWGENGHEVEVGVSKSALSR